ncbi:MAG: hypothetical protein M5T61_15370 [Acidimicrobiia bacterium]|nr:hypothetical protein [Acidimicrobiia bacterium]
MPPEDETGRHDDLEELSLDELIGQITVDAYGDQGYWSFRQAFEDHVDFPIPASVIGTEVTMTEIDFDGDERRGLTATVKREGRTRTVSLLDIDIPDDQVRFTRLTCAHRRWLGTDG